MHDPNAAAGISELTCTVYVLSKFIVIPGWLLLVASLFMPRWRRSLWPITQFVVPALLSLLYLLMVWDGRAGFHEYGWKTFFRIEGINELYNYWSALNAGWLHFLAVDLFAATCVVRDGLARRMPVVAILICLPLIMMLAPAGLLLYFALRYAFRSRAPAAEPEAA
ncbi:MAG: hypothetical protein QOJ27_1986 [Sphingomonadales bacterium]|jgi:hypothetical protein|nr:hypothetical protein [Sphingomonadales bacterium]